MKKPKLSKVRTALVVQFFIIALLIVSLTYVYGQSGNTFIISEGIYPHGVYTIWREGSYYYAKDSFGLQPVWSGGTNASYVIQSSINVINEGIIFIKEGTYICDTALTISGASKRVSLIGEGMEATILQFSGDIDGIVLNTNYHIKITDLKILGDNGQTNDGLDIINVQNLHFENLLIDFWNDTGSAVRLQSVWDCDFINIRHERSWVGLSIQHSVNNNVWINCRFRSNVNHGILINSNSSNGNIFITSDISGNSVGAQIDYGIQKITFFSSWFELNEQYGIRTRSQGGENVTGLSIQDCSFLNQTDHLVLPFTVKAVINSCFFYGGTTAINIYSTTYFATISNNVDDGDPPNFVSDGGAHNTTTLGNMGYP